MTKVFGVVAWLAVGDHRRLRARPRPGDRDARAAVRLDGDLGHPDGPADVRPDDALVRRTAPGGVEGGREVADRRRDPRRHHGHQQRQDRHADDERHDRDDHARGRRLVQDRGRRLQQDRRDPRRRRAEPPDFPRLALGLALCTDATVGDDGSVIGDPTEAALVVLAAKIGVDAEETRRASRAAPRCRSTPSTSSWRRSTTARTGSRAGS